MRTHTKYKYKIGDKVKIIDGAVGGLGGFIGKVGDVVDVFKLDLDADSGFKSKEFCNVDFQNHSSRVFLFNACSLKHYKEKAE